MTELITRLKRLWFGPEDGSSMSQPRRHAYNYPLPDDKELRCRQDCGEVMQWHVVAHVFECDCRRFGISEEALKETGPGLFDVEVRQITAD